MHKFVFPVQPNYNRPIGVIEREFREWLEANVGPEFSKEDCVQYLLHGRTRDGRRRGWRMLLADRDNYPRQGPEAYPLSLKFTHPNDAVLLKMFLM